MNTDNIKWLGHSSVKIISNNIIYIDPYNLKEDYNDADIIFITHAHYDHYSPEDILKCKKDTTKIVITEDLYERTISLGFKENDIIKVLPNNTYKVNNITFNTIPAYNTNKSFHPKHNNWVGYVILIDNNRYYIAGDTDITPESKTVKCDIAFLPIGGTFTMDAREASSLANTIEPKVVVPIHYGSIVGTKEDLEIFKTNLKDNIKCDTLILKK